MALSPLRSQSLYRLSSSTHLSELDSELNWMPAAQLLVKRRPARDPDLESLRRPPPWTPLRSSTPQPSTRRAQPFKHNLLDTNNRSTASTPHEIDSRLKSHRSESFVSESIDTDGFEPVPEGKPVSHAVVHSGRGGALNPLVQKPVGYGVTELGLKQNNESGLLLSLPFCGFCLSMGMVKTCANGWIGPATDRTGPIQIGSQGLSVLNLGGVAHSPGFSPIAPMVQANGSSNRVPSRQWGDDENEFDNPTGERRALETGFTIAGGSEGPSGREEEEVQGMKGGTDQVQAHQQPRQEK